MTRKRLLAVGGLVSVLMCVGFVVALVFMSMEPRVSKKNAEMIERGMSMSKVTAILGTPHYCPGEIPKGTRFAYRHAWIKNAHVYMWQSSECIVLIGFDRELMVRDKLCERNDEKSFVDKIRRSLCLRLR